MKRMIGGNMTLSFSGNRPNHQKNGFVLMRRNAIYSAAAKPVTHSQTMSAFGGKPDIAAMVRTGGYFRSS